MNFTIKQILVAYCYEVRGGIITNYNTVLETAHFSFDTIMRDKASPLLDGENYALVGVCENNDGSNELVFIYIDNTNELPTADTNRWYPFKHIYCSMKYLEDNNLWE
jgi:hypothetical protein